MCSFHIALLLQALAALHAVSKFRKKKQKKPKTLVSWFCKGGWRSRQQLNLNLTDKDSLQDEPSLEEVRARRIWGQFRFFFSLFLLNPCLTPYRDPERLAGKDQGLRRSFWQMKMMHGFHLLRSVCFLPLLDVHTHTPSSFSLYLYLLCATLYTNFSVFGCCPTPLSSLFISLAKTGTGRLRGGSIRGDILSASLCREGYLWHSRTFPLLSLAIREAAEQSGKSKPEGVFTLQEYWYCEALVHIVP